MQTRIFIISLILGAIMTTHDSYSEEGLQRATFGGGCFWCLEPPFEALDGVTDVSSGYMGGTVENPTYEQVSSGKTGHYEVVQISYDPAKITYEQLLDTFWRQIDPTDQGGQFADRGTQYKTAIFYHSVEQKQAARNSIDALNKSGKLDKPVVTEILPAGTFYRAEDYHQDYYKTSPAKYKMYRSGSGRESYIEKTWKD